MRYDKHGAMFIIPFYRDYSNWEKVCYHNNTKFIYLYTKFRWSLTSDVCKCLHFFEKSILAIKCGSVCIKELLEYQHNQAVMKCKKREISSLT